MKKQPNLPKVESRIIRNWGKIGDFSVFFLILGANTCFWVKNRGWYVDMRGMGKISKIKTSKNEYKLT
jgi:hypothetical protein